MSRISQKDREILRALAEKKRTYATDSRNEAILKQMYRTLLETVKSDFETGFFALLAGSPVFLSTPFTFLWKSVIMKKTRGELPRGKEEHTLWNRTKSGSV